VDKPVLGQDFSQYFGFPRLFPLGSKRILHSSTTDGTKSLQLEASLKSNTYLSYTHTHTQIILRYA